MYQGYYFLRNQDLNLHVMHFFTYHLASEYIHVGLLHEQITKTVCPACLRSATSHENLIRNREANGCRLLKVSQRLTMRVRYAQTKS